MDFLTVKVWEHGCASGLTWKSSPCASLDMDYPVQKLSTVRIPVGFGGRRLPYYPNLLGNLSLKGVTFVSCLSHSSAISCFLWNGDAVSR